MKIHPQIIIIFQKHLTIIISLNTSAEDIEPIFPVTSKTPLKTRERSISINPISDFTIGLAPPNGQSFRDNILKMLVKILLKYLMLNLSTLKLNVKTL